MIILDTNVLSEIGARLPNQSVLAWLDEQEESSLWTTSISVFEAISGLLFLPEGSRRTGLLGDLEEMLRTDLQNRILSFDEQAARATALVAAQRRRRGITIDPRDTQIAGIAIARRATIATRNARHFEDLDVPVVNPWEQ